MANSWIYLLALLPLVHCADNPFFLRPIQVTSDAGTFMGNAEYTYSFGKNRTYDAFRGIRYAKPPVGNLRYRKPVPVDKFQGVYDATEYLLSCPQPSLGFDLFRYTMVDPLYHERTGEDCLSLNVFKPSTPSATKRAVMVYIHGGGWNVGAALVYFPAALVTQGDVVYVAMNFRLGPFGFLSTGDSVVPGNLAYFDQLLALKWVKKNIASFGGDPDNVTIFGESAGGFDVTAHSISPLSSGAGLFKRAISQSGTAVSPKHSPMQVNKLVPMQTKNLGFNLKCNDSTNPNLTDTKKLVECLRTKRVEDIMKYTNIYGNLPSDAVNKGQPVVFGAVVDGEFLPANPSDLVADPSIPAYQSFKNIDFMVSSCSNDGDVFFETFITSGLLASLGVKKPQYAVPKQIMDNVLLPATFAAVENKETVIRAVQQEYMVKADVAKSDIMRRDQFVQISTDMTFNAPAMTAARVHAKMNGPGKTYFFYFNHNTSIYPSSFGAGNARHGADLFAVFGFLAMKDNLQKLNMTQALKMGPTAVEEALAKAAVTYITNYAKYGKPNGLTSPTPYPSWPEFTTNDQKYMEFGSNATSIVLEVKTDLRPRAMSFWIDYITYVVGQACKPPQCPMINCAVGRQAYIESLRLTVGQAEVIIIVFAALTGTFGALSLLTLLVYCKMRRRLSEKSLSGSYDVK